MLPIRNQNNGSISAAGRILSVILIGFFFAGALMALYVITVLQTTADKKLQDASK